MNITINLKFDFGQCVYLVTDKEQLERMVIEIKLDCKGCILYGLALGSEQTWHFDTEITDKKDILKSLQ